MKALLTLLSLRRVSLALLTALCGSGCVSPESLLSVSDPSVSMSNPSGTALAGAPVYQQPRPRVWKPWRYRYAPRRYYSRPVVYRRPVVYGRPGVYRRPVVYGRPGVYRRPVAYSRPVVYNRPAVVKKKKKWRN